MIITGQFIFLFMIALLLTMLALWVDSKSYLKMAGASSVKPMRVLFVFLLTLTLIGMGIMNFQVTLTLFMFGTGIIVLIDRLFFHRARVSAKKVRPYVVENAYSFFGVLLTVWVIRSFLIQPYRVPTGSLQPTVAPGDFLLVQQFAYGLKFPIGNKQLMATHQPQRGDIALFYYPVDPNVVFVKRVIGVPGDHIQFNHEVLWINGKEMQQTNIGSTIDNEPAEEGNPEEHIRVQEKEENLNGIKHKIYMTNIDTPLSQDFNIHVPPGQYFMMGDNRDNSDDSRVWGFVPENFFIGKAFRVWMSWDAIEHKVRWDRIGLGVK